MPRQPNRLQAVVYKKDDWWIAVCLDNGLATQARSRDEIGTELQRLLGVQIRATLEHGLPPFAALPKAPEKYWRMFGSRNGAAPQSFDLPAGFTVEAYEVSPRVPALV